MNVVKTKSSGTKSALKVTAPEKPQAAMPPALVPFRKYQSPIFQDRQIGVLVLHWSRQIGKSYTLAAWAVDRLLTKLQTYPTWLVTVLSNSRDNGAEFNLKAAEICTKLGLALDTVDESPDLKYENMRMEVRVTVVVDGSSRVGRIKVLAANPRTARGFSGDLILDEFAFHEDSNAIWEAAEPILSSNSEFLCRIASTGNGKHNMFFRMASGTGHDDGKIFRSALGFSVSRVTRTEAWRMGVKVFDPNTRQPITPSEARAKALDKRAYDQNYECQFTDENMCLLTLELISSAQRSPASPIDEQEWSPATINRLAKLKGDLYLGQDVGRTRDLSVICVIEKQGTSRRVVALLRMSGLRLPVQQVQLGLICRLPKFRAGCIDMTGLGLGLVEYAQEEAWGRTRIYGVNFASTEPINDRLVAEGRKKETARVTENMATALLGAFEERSVEFHVALDVDAIDDLRKPERITSPGGRVSIAAVRDDAGHADHFWALALALRAAEQGAGPVAYAPGRNIPWSRPAQLPGIGRQKTSVPL